MNILGDGVKLLRRCIDEYRSGKSDIHEKIDDFDDMEELGHGFSSADSLEKK